MPNNASFMKYLGDENPHSMFLRPTCESEILKIIGKFDRKKSSNPDLISVNMVKACAEHLSNPLAKIINCSFETGVFPKELKTAKVIPIHKKKKSIL